MVSVTLQFDSPEQLVEFFTRHRPTTAVVEMAERPSVVKLRPDITPADIQADAKRPDSPEPALTNTETVTDDVLRQAALDLGKQQNGTATLKRILGEFGARRVIEVQGAKRAELLDRLRAGR